MRILHAIKGMDPWSGGPPNALFGLVKGQLAHGLAITIVSAYRPGFNRTLIDQLEAFGADVRMVGPVGKSARHRDLGRVMAEAVAQADLVHIHGVWLAVEHAAAREARRAGKPYLIRPCGMLAPWSLSQNALRKRFYLAWRLKSHLDHAAAIHYTARQEQLDVAPLGIRAPALVETNGVDLAEFEELPPRGAFRGKHGIAPDRPLVLFLSRIHQKKGLDLLVPAFARAQTGDALLVIAGPRGDDYHRQVEGWIQEHGLADRAIMLDMLHGRDRIEAMVDADLFVLPSYQENFGIVVVEALASGTPVVISDQVAIHAEIAQAGVGEVVPAEVSPLSAAIGRWLGDQALRASAAAQARAFVRRMYDWDRIAERWVGHYEHLAAQASKPPREASVSRP